MSRHTAARLASFTTTLLLAGSVATAATTIPFQVQYNKIVLQVRVNDPQGARPLDVILDTGMVAGILLNDPDLARELGLKTDGRITVEGAGAGAPVRAGVAYGVSLGIGDQELKWQPAVVMPRGSEYVRLSRCLPFSGVVGYSIFSRWVVEIDYESRLIHLHEPADFRHDADDDGEGEVLPLTIEDKKPYVRGRATLAGGIGLPVKLAIDTGAGGSLYLNREADERIRVPAHNVEVTLGRGVLGKRRGRVGRIPALQLGSLEVRDVVTGFPNARIRGLAEDRHGLIGNDLLSRFNVTFDYERKRMILKPNRRFDSPFEYDMVGMQFDPGRSNDCRLKVDEVVDGSPAQAAGVRLGDVLVGIDDTAASELTRSGIEQLFQAAPGREYRLRLRRGCETVAVVVRLDRLL